MIVSWGKLFHVAVSDHRTDDARKAAEQELTYAERLVGIDPSHTDWVAMMLGAAEDGAGVEYQDDHFDAAFARVEQPIALAAQLVDHTDSLSLRDAYANLMCHAADYENQANKPDTLARAADLATRCLAIEEALHARVPDSFDYYRGVGVAHERLGDMHAQRNEWQEAADEYRQRIAVDTELLRRDPKNARRKIDLASDQFNTGLAVTHVAGHAAEGVTLLQTAYDSLQAMKAAGELSREFEAALPEYAKQLDAAKARK
jgi:tetratricopeptide (TPR) repeat protein